MFGSSVMNTSRIPISPNETGAYGELAARPNPDGLVIVFEPPFGIAVRAGQTLTRDEIEAARNKAPCIVLTKEAAEQMYIAQAKRGLS